MAQRQKIKTSAPVTSRPPIRFTPYSSIPPSASDTLSTASHSHAESGRRRRNRRYGRDILLNILTVLGYVNTLVVIVAAVLLTKAKPDTFHSMYRGLPLKNYWHPQILRYLFALCVFGFFVSLTGLFINSQRLKRKGDSIRWHLITVWVLSLAGIVAYLIN